MEPPTLFTIPVLCYIIFFVAPVKAGAQGASGEALERWVPACARTTREAHEQLAMVSVVQHEKVASGLSYRRAGMYGRYALQESVRQMRESAPAQIPGAKISVCQGVGGMFAAAKNPRATFKTPITVEDVLNSRMIAPFRLMQCCLVTDGGGALILVSAERARDFPQKPVYLLGTGKSVETPMVRTSRPSRAFRVAGPTALCRGRHHAQRR
jgi:hypothetical protein